MRVLPIIIAFLSIYTALFSQKVVDIHPFFQDTIDVDFLFGNEFEYLQDFDGAFSANHLPTENFKPNKSYYYRDFAASNVWVRLSLTNSSPKQSYPFFFLFPYFDKVTYYQKTENKYQLLWSSEFNNRLDYDLPIEDTLTLLMHWQNVDRPIGMVNPEIWHPSLFTQVYFELRKAKYTKYKARVFISTFFSGSFLILFLYHLMLFFQTRKKDYLYYCCYVLALFLYFFPKSSLFSLEYHFNHQWLMHQHIYNIIIQSILYIFYFQFARSFLSTWKQYPALDKWFKVLIWSSLVFLAVLYLEFQWQWTGQFNIWFGYFRVFISVNCAGILIYMFKVRHSSILIHYMWFGGTFFLIGGVLAMYFSGNGRSHNFIVPVDLMRIGSMIEILIFALGLGYRYKMIEQDKIKTQALLIEELQVNDQLQKQLESQLKEQLSLATYEKQIAQLESQLLRSRMNPHFIFNSMNALKRFVLENKTASASNYLDKFSTLLRQVLTNSGKKQIALHDEIEALKNYLELERNRLENQFDFEIKIDASIDTHYTQIPPMLLQPFVENAIWHGVRHLTNRKGKIILSLQQAPDAILIQIEDNGVGRVQAAQINQSLRNNHQSMATQLTNKRLQLLETYDNILIDIQIKDKPNHSGTIVHILLAE